MKKSREIWVEQPLEKHWLVRFKFIEDAHGNPILAEMRVAPKNSIPKGGLSMRNVRKINVHKSFVEAYRKLQR